MDDNSTLESANVKKESTLHWMPDKKVKFFQVENIDIQKQFFIIPLSLYIDSLSLALK